MPQPKFTQQLVDALNRADVGTVATDQKTLASASHDASLFELVPGALVQPETTADVEHLVAFVNKHAGVSLTARSAGTDMSGGPLTTSLVVSFTEHFNKIIAINQTSATVQPGVYYRDFEKETLKRGLLLPSYPASRSICTVGGMVANNSGGEKSLTYGKTAEYVESLKVVLADGREHMLTTLSPAELADKKKQQDFEGNVYRELDKLVTDNAGKLADAKPKVSKNSAGYALWNVKNAEKKTFDLAQLIVGSQGTLGLVSEITFRLIRPKKHREMVVMFLHDFAQLADITLKVLAHRPETFESYDDHTLKVALRFLPSLARELGTNALTMAWQFLPEAGMVLRGGLPKLVLMAEFTGDSQAEANQRARAAARDVADLPIQVRVVSNPRENDDFWIIRRDSFNLLRQKIHNLHTAPFIDDFIVPPATLPDFLPQLYALLDEEKLLVTVTGHVGDGNFHIIPLMDIARPDLPDLIKRLSEKVYGLVIRYGGSITAEHNDGLIRSPYLKQMFGPDVYHLFEQTKAILDPKGIFNPGKKVDSDLDWALKNLRTSW